MDTKGPKGVHPRLPPLPLSDDLWNVIAAELAFSPQQKRIVELILRNACDKQNASLLGRRRPTIRTHLDRIFRRLNVEDRGELVLLIFRLSHRSRQQRECCHGG